MKHAIVGSLTALLAGAGLALAQQPDEALPRPRTLSAATNEVPADQAAASAVPIPPGGPGDPGGYGPPPAMLAPVCPGPGTPFRLWADGDYHLWWLKKNNFPTLLESLPAGGAPQVLVGGDSLDRALRNGGGADLGAWFTDYQGFGIEGGFFVMESANKEFNFSGTGAAGSPIIVRPFFDVLSGQQAVLPIAAPGLFSGSATGATSSVQCDSGRFAGANIDFIGNIGCGPTGRFDFLIGYRYLTLDDRFGMESTTAATDGLLLAQGTAALASITDRIDTSSRFNGFDVGLRGEWHWDRLLVRATAKVAFGASDENATLTGQTSLLSPPTVAFPAGIPTVAPGGFLVRPSNSGTTSTEQFAVVPELGLTLGYQVFDWMRFTVGYSFLYWSNVARSGDQVNLSINRLEVPALTAPTGFTPLQPLATIHCTDFWAQGLNVGLEFRF